MSNRFTKKNYTNGILTMQIDEQFYSSLLSILKVIATLTTLESHVQIISSKVNTLYRYVKKICELTLSSLLF
jgi:hypothetical protein